MQNKPILNFEVVDFSVSKKTFELIYNPTLHLYKTSPQPSVIELPAYYISEDYISHTDANQSLFDKIYQIVKRKTLRSKLNLIEKQILTKEKILLDIGCGTGDFLLTAKKAKWSVVGVEPHSEAASLANKKLNLTTQIYSSLDHLITSKEQKKFSVITLWHVLEHVPDYDEYISKIKSLLEPNGTLIVAVPNFNSYDAKYYQSYWAAFDVPRHLWHFSQNAIHSIFQNHQMKVIKTKPMWFDAFYVSLLSEKFINGKTHFIKAFWIGLVSNFKTIFNSECSSLIYVIQNKKN